jgi:hypothetical protein
VSGGSITGEAAEEALPATIVEAEARRSRGRRRRVVSRPPVWSVVALALAAVYFLVPLYATAVFGLCDPAGDTDSSL